MVGGTEDEYGSVSCVADEVRVGTELVQQVRVDGGTVVDRTELLERLVQVQTDGMTEGEQSR